MIGNDRAFLGEIIQFILINDLSAWSAVNSLTIKGIIIDFDRIVTVNKAKWEFLLKN